MGLDADAVIDAFWEASDDLPEDAIPNAYLLRLLGGVCERLHRVEPSERFREEARECRASEKLTEQLLSGEQVRLAYAYSAFGDGFVELATFNAELTEGGESGTVVGTPGVRIRFDESEARRAIQILGALFPAARSDAL